MSSNFQKHILLFSMLIFFIGYLSGAVAGEGNPFPKQPRYSLVMIDDIDNLFSALGYISDQTGISISITGINNNAMNKKKFIQKREWKDKTLENILNDLFKKENKAILWHSKDSLVEHIEVFLAPKTKGRNQGKNYSFNPGRAISKASLSGSLYAKKIKQNNQPSDFVSLYKIKSTDNEHINNKRTYLKKNENYSSQYIGKDSLQNDDKNVQYSRSVSGNLYRGDEPELVSEKNAKNSEQIPPSLPGLLSDLEPPPMPPGM